MIRLASKIAAKSKFRRARVGAVLVKGGRVIATGCNRIGYSKYLPDRPYPESVHAEQQAILQLLKVRRLHDLSGSTMFISRIGSDGRARLSKPCAECSDLINAVGITKVIYTTDTGVAEYEQ